MAYQPPLSPALEAPAQELVARLRPQAESELVALARLLVSKGESDSFGDTEFEARDSVHRLGAKAVATHRAEKKRLRRFGHRLSPRPASRLLGTVTCQRAYY